MFPWCLAKCACKSRANLSSLSLPVAEVVPGVFLYLGYSKKDSFILTKGRNKIQDKRDIPGTEDEERNEVKNTIQQTVSHFTSNTNKVTHPFPPLYPCV